MIFIMYLMTSLYLNDSNNSQTRLFNSINIDLQHIEKYILQNMINAFPEKYFLRGLFR